MQQYVVVHNDGGAYTSYKSFFLQNGLEHLQENYIEHEDVPIERILLLVAVGKHNISDDLIFVLKDWTTKQIYLLSSQYTSRYTIIND